MMRRLLALPLLTALLFGGLAVAPATAAGPPETLAAQAAVGDLRGAGRVIAPAHPVDHLGVSWRGAAELSVRFRVNGAWTRWQEVEDDGHPSRGRSFSDLVDGADAEAYQLSGRGRDVRAVAINTTDGRRTTARGRAAQAELVQPGVVSRSTWGADENLRFKNGSEVWPPAFAPTQKLVVHHTATKNDDPDPAATVRAIYRYHAVDKGWGDIGYNFLVDAQGRIYKGRWSGVAGAKTGDTVTGENADRHGVTAAHAAGANSGTMGIAVLGDYDTSASPSAASVQAVVDHLAWESDRHRLDPLATSLYTNPVNGSTKTVDNISAHRDWNATACPGKNLYAKLPDIRSRVAAAVPPTTPTGLKATAADGAIDLDWADNPELDLAGYGVDRSLDGSTWEQAATLTSSAWRDTAVTGGTTYYYRVLARDTAGRLSPPSGAVSTTTAGSTSSDPAPAPAPVPTTGTALVDEVNVQKGNAGTWAGRLDADDASRFDVTTTKQGRHHVTAWTARWVLPKPSTISALTIDLDGLSSASTTRVLEVYDVAAQVWREVDKTAVAGADARSTWTPSTPSAFVDASGRLQVRVSTSGTSSATTGTDLLTAAVTWTG